MLKSNTKKAKENIRNYIIDCMNLEGLGYSEYYYIFDKVREAEATGTNIDKWSLYKHALQNIFYTEYEQHHTKYYRTRIDCFKGWMQGLPLCFNQYLRGAREDLATILEETEAEAERFTEEQACERLTELIYREMNA